MNAMLRVLHSLAVIPLLMSGCALSPAPADEEEAQYQKL